MQVSGCFSTINGMVVAHPSWVIHPMKAELIALLLIRLTDINIDIGTKVTKHFNLLNPHPPAPASF
jgi:hypothetical protein